MAITTGRVISIGKDGLSQVMTAKKGACGGCEVSHGCHACLSDSRIITDAMNNAGAKEGDLVTISLNTGLILKSAAIIYLIPIIGLMAGAIISTYLSISPIINESISTIAFSFAGLFLGFLFAFLISKQISKNNKYTPIIDSIINPIRKLDG